MELLGKAGSLPRRNEGDKIRELLSPPGPARFCCSALQTHTHGNPPDFRVLWEMFKVIYLFHLEGNVFLS